VKITLTQQQTQSFVAMASKGPCILGTFIAGKIKSGQKVNEKSGKTEAWAGFQYSILVGNDIVTVKQYEDDEKRIVAMAAAAARDGDAEFMPATPGTPVIVLLRSLQYQKGLTVASGEVHPFK